jgi:hypothetical protein
MHSLSAKKLPKTPSPMISPEKMPFLSTFPEKKCIIYVIIFPLDLFDI